MEEHNTNLRATLARAKTRGVTPKLSKSTICATEVKWFGLVFSGSGVSADPAKIHHIIQAGKPETIEDVRSLLLSMMNDKTYLAPYNPNYKTHLVTDASPWGISASIYQEDKQNRWIPVDHITRALSP